MKKDDDVGAAPALLSFPASSSRDESVSTKSNGVFANSNNAASSSAFESLVMPTEPRVLLLSIAAKKSSSPTSPEPISNGSPLLLFGFSVKVAVVGEELQLLSNASKLAKLASNDPTNMSNTGTSSSSSSSSVPASLLLLLDPDFFIPLPSSPRCCCFVLSPPSSLDTTMASDMNPSLSSSSTCSFFFENPSTWFLSSSSSSSLLLLLSKGWTPPRGSSYT
mmetsp:Transcript_11457/g.18600  ORF Transcript_11457/g.18600 Transcript_11457/m.18600 type:complete len:221 (-) Transcript_11457:308-970(-)